MPSIARKIINHVQVYGYGILATLLLLLVAQTSFESDTPLLLAIEHALRLVTTLVAAVTVAQSRTRAILATLIAIPAIMRDVFVLIGFDSQGGFIISLSGQGLFWFVAICLVVDLLRRRGELPTQLLTAICLYIVMAFAFSRAYLAIEQWADISAFSPNALTGPNATLSEYDATYFSFVTQTTLGYGDITPVARSARALAVIQATIGVLYIAVVVAAIVGANQDKTINTTPRSNSRSSDSV